MKRSELRQIIKEELLNEESFSENLHNLHLAQTEEEFKAIVKDMKKQVNWSEKEILGMLKGYRKKLGYTGPMINAKEKKPAKPKKKAVYDPNKWTKRKYEKWIKDNAWFEGDDEDKPSDYGHDMAQNAKYEKGLIDYVQGMIWREGGDESPLERIQWDIEAQG